MKNYETWFLVLAVRRLAWAILTLPLLSLAAHALDFEVEPPDSCDYSDVDAVAAPESCEFRIVNWNASGNSDSWNLGNDRQVADFVIQHIVDLDANVITLQEVTALSLTYLQQDLSGWNCYFDMFALDDHIAVCVDGVGTNFNSERLRNVSNDPSELPPDPPGYWWGYVQVEYQGVLITSVHTRSKWKEEHVTELHEDVTTGIIAGDFNYIEAHHNPNVSEDPDAIPGPDWHQTDVDLEWTIDEIVRDENDVIIDQIKEKIDHILTVEEPAVVWGDACLDGRDDVPEPFHSAHRILLGRVAFQTKPEIEARVTNVQQPVSVDSDCAAVVEFQIDIHDSCCLDPDDLELEVIASDLEANATLGPVAIDGISQIGSNDIRITGHVEVTSLQSCEANVVINATAQDCTGNSGDTTLQQTWATVTITDTTPPTAMPPADVTVQCDFQVPPPDTSLVTTADNCDAVTVEHESDIDDGRTCPRTITRTYSVTDRCGHSVDAIQTITVHDTMPPQVAVSDEDLYVLWPPNHKYRCFDAAGFSPLITDNCDAQLTWWFDACASNQPDDAIGGGDGNTVRDCVLDADAQGLCARAERAGNDRAGRRYEMSIRAADACDNVSPSTPIGNLFVPHSKR